MFKATNSLPKFKAEKIEILHAPKEFRKAIEHGILNAKKSEKR